MKTPRTRMKTVTGKVHIVEGRPQDFIVMMNGIGRSDVETLTNVKGRKFKLADVLTMQLEE